MFVLFFAVQRRELVVIHGLQCCDGKDYCYYDDDDDDYHCVRVRACVRAYMRACVRACVCVRARAVCVCVCVCA